ncbi:uncharacterized protein LOC118767051 [Octopus sinensis]|uniref:Uncharacterized protein LOC118767051 n=1 Tax=Octopus sinensis TaxID=2607531 RepID=A0A7E6FGI6_9MOLL|nr:uncharacterized protein LOC118767051 [Octopus sinensis]
MQESKALMELCSKFNLFNYVSLFVNGSTMKKTAFAYIYIDEKLAREAVSSLIPSRIAVIANVRDLTVVKTVAKGVIRTLYINDSDSALIPITITNVSVVTIAPILIPIINSMAGSRRSRSAPARSSSGSPLCGLKVDANGQQIPPSPSSKAWVDTRQIQKLKEEPMEIRNYDSEDVERMHRRRKDELEIMPNRKQSMLCTKRNALLKQRKRELRSQETQEAREARLDDQRSRDQRSLCDEPVEARQARLAFMRIRNQRSLLVVSEEARQARLAAQRSHNQRSLLQEPAEAREARPAAQHSQRQISSL